MADDKLESVDQNQPGAAGLVEDSSAENTPEVETEASPAPERNDSVERELMALRERLARQEERNGYLEETQRLQQAALRQQQQPTQQGSGLSPDLDELNKTLDPLFQYHIERVSGPYNEALAKIYDQNDAVSFELYLQRNHPDIVGNEDELNRVYQQVEVVRRAAAERQNQWLPRSDAFMYAQGMGKIRESKQRKSNRSSQDSAEAKRQAQVAATRSGESSNEKQRQMGGNIEAIRAKARRGDRLTPQERAQLANAIADQSF